MEEIESLVKTAAAADVAAEERLAAFGEIVRRYQDMAYGCAYAILGDFHPPGLTVRRAETTPPYFNEEVTVILPYNKLVAKIIRNAREFFLNALLIPGQILV